MAGCGVLLYMCGVLCGIWVRRCKRGGRPSKEGLAALLKSLSSLMVCSPGLKWTDGPPLRVYIFKNQSGVVWTAVV